MVATVTEAPKFRFFAPADLRWAEGEAVALLGEPGGVFRGHDNANYLMLDYIKGMIDEMREGAESNAESLEKQVSDKET